MDIKKIYWLDGVLFAVNSLINAAWREFDEGDPNKKRLQEAMEITDDVKRDLRRQIEGDK